MKDKDEPKSRMALDFEGTHANRGTKRSDCQQTTAKKGLFKTEIKHQAKGTKHSPSPTLLLHMCMYSHLAWDSFGFERIGRAVLGGELYATAA